MYVKRDTNGAICAVSIECETDVCEAVASDSIELSRFLERHTPQVKESLAHSDLQMARVMEDVVNLLIDKHVIQFTELPNAAQQKLMSRREMRGQFQAINLLSDEEDITI